MTSSPWTPERIATAQRMWREGEPLRRIVEAIFVKRNTFVSFANRHRDLFPQRHPARRQAKMCAPPKDAAPVQKPPCAATLIGGHRIGHVKRHHPSGEIHTMPRVSMIDGHDRQV